MLRVVLAQSGDIVLPELGEWLGRYAQEKLRRRGAEVRLAARVSEYDNWSLSCQSIGLRRTVNRALPATTRSNPPLRFPCPFHHFSLLQDRFAVLHSR